MESYMFFGFMWCLANFLLGWGLGFLLFAHVRHLGLGLRLGSGLGLGCVDMHTIEVGVYGCTHNWLHMLKWEKHISDRVCSIYYMYMCACESVCMLFKVYRCVIYGEFFAHVSLYVYACACDSVWVCVLVRRCVCIWWRVCAVRSKGVPLCWNQIRTHSKACVIQVEGGRGWFDSNVYPWEGLLFV